MASNQYAGAQQMTPPKYIGPHDVPVIRAAVQQMLCDGVPRAHGRYLFHDSAPPR